MLFLLVFVLCRCVHPRVVHFENCDSTWCGCGVLAACHVIFRAFLSPLCEGGEERSDSNASQFGPLVYRFTPQVIVLFGTPMQPWSAQSIRFLCCVLRLAGAAPLEPGCGSHHFCSAFLVSLPLKLLFFRTHMLCTHCVIELTSRRRETRKGACICGLTCCCSGWCVCLALVVRRVFGLCLLCVLLSVFAPHVQRRRCFGRRRWVHHPSRP